MSTVKPIVCPYALQSVNSKLNPSPILAYLVSKVTPKTLPEVVVLISGTVCLYSQKIVNCKGGVEIGLAGGDAGNTDAGGDAGSGGDGICGNRDDSRIDPEQSYVYRSDRGRRKILGAPPPPYPRPRPHPHPHHWHHPYRQGNQLDTSGISLRPPTWLLLRSQIRKYPGESYSGVLRLRNKVRGAGGDVWTPGARYVVRRCGNLISLFCVRYGSSGIMGGPSTLGEPMFVPSSIWT
ncbi:hypothetical protein Tco_0409937 [Tanacetum coccineum]